ncbi:uncharacterized protein BXZ73DRAFT_54984 [Epithele typhae]|uniref:uncharacterized protein n=1 Tax=Epithele typhae TaxID=378194 RepID=UPI0020072A9A|nr:uncharacterized protein BXZ73DRAFT_54984 [Epithele typhae]KAH9914374.1 hypothetical protein BXZ73DRAFT_54984 [Epithele typhae]
MGAQPREAQAAPWPAPDPAAQRAQEYADHDRKVQRNLARINACAFGKDAPLIAARYEATWKAIKDSPDSAFEYKNFPFPVFFPLDIPPLPAHITYERVKAFVLSPVRSNGEISNRKQIKDETRRWHPDHFSKTLRKVREDHRDLVKEAADVVIRCLTDLKADPTI